MLQLESNDLQKANILLSNLLNRLNKVMNQISFHGLLNESIDLAKDRRIGNIFKNKKGCRRIVNPHETISN